MLKKIISIKNVGRFRSSAASPNPQLGKYTFILGANGFGKTTICSVLRSLHTGDANHIIGRRTLGVTDNPTVELLLESGPTSFNGTVWTLSSKKFAIFDGTFIAQNVYSGEVVDLDHKRSLYRVIIGEAGASLAEQDTLLAAESREKNSEISGVERAIRLHVPAGMTLEQFLAIPADANIETKVTEQEHKLEAISQASEIKNRPGLSEISLGDIPETLDPLLIRTIDDIGDDVENVIAAHLAAHEMTDTGENWVAEGLLHAGGESCPFCGQSVTGQPLVTAYRVFFGEAYRQLKKDIVSEKITIRQLFGEATIGRVSALIYENQAAVEFWKRYCTLDSAQLSPPNYLADTVRNLEAQAQTLLDCKSGSPLEAITPEFSFAEAKTSYIDLQEEIAKINIAIEAGNAQIASKKAATDAADLKLAQIEMNRLKAIKTRHDMAVDKLCADYVRLMGEKNDIDVKKEATRGKLDAHTENVVKPYEDQINEYLISFNAGFQIAQTKHAYPGGVATSSYQLVINLTAVDLGDERTPQDRPSFKNTLSAGDRTTLAMAFFLAHLEKDPGRTEKIVVFDDPFTSQDAFRRRQTVHEIKKVGEECAQVIILSHDVTFLKQVWEKSPASGRIAFLIYDARSLGSKILLMDIDRACQGRVASEIDDLMMYVTTGAGKPLDLIKKMRVVLEAHCRATYPAYFDASDWLGEMVGKIGTGGEEHPARGLYDELDQINDYTASYHHGDDGDDTTPDAIDPDELTGFVRKTMKIVNALQA